MKKRDMNVVYKNLKLSGFEGGQIVIEDLWAAEQMRTPFLKDTDIDKLRFRIQGEEQKVFNDIIKKYYLGKELTNKLEKLELEVQNNLLTMLHFMDHYIRKFEIHRIIKKIPITKTTTQLEEEGQIQKQYLGEDFYELEFVIGARAEQINAEKKEGHERSDYYSIDWLDAKEPDLYNEALDKIISLIKEEQLHPLFLEKTDRIIFEELTQKSNYFQNRRAFWQENKERLYRNETNITNILFYLESIRDKYVVDKGKRELMENIFFSGRELYNTDLKEWKKWMETFKADLDLAGHAVYDKRRKRNKIAVIENLVEADLDEKGYYREDYITEELAQLGYSEENIKTILATLYTETNEKLDLIAMYKIVIEKLAHALHIDFLKSIKACQERFDKLIDLYNAHFYMAQAYYCESRMDCEAIKLCDYEPDDAEIRALFRKMKVDVGVRGILCS